MENFRIGTFLLTIVVTGAVLIAASLYLQRASLKVQLAETGQQCTVRTAHLVEQFETQLDEIQFNIARFQKSVAASPASSTRTEPRESNDIVRVELPAPERFDETLDDIVNRKYRFLFARLALDAATREALYQLMLEREQVALEIRDARDYGDEIGMEAGDISQLEYELEEIDDRIQDLLDEDNSQRYALLKDSDNEQEHFNQYTRGVNGLFPLDREQQESLLFSKLRHKQAFEQTVAASGLDRNYPLTDAQRSELLSKLEMAAQRYKHAFLQEIRMDLDHDNYPMDQYTLLENYTNTEFQELLAELRNKIDERGVL